MRAMQPHSIAPSCTRKCRKSKRSAARGELGWGVGARGSLVVTSAMAGVTDALVELGEQARRGAVDAAQHLAARLAQQHHRAIVDLELRDAGEPGIAAERALRELLEASLMR